MNERFSYLIGTLYRLGTLLGRQTDSILVQYWHVNNLVKFQSPYFDGKSDELVIVPFQGEVVV